MRIQSHTSQSINFKSSFYDKSAALEKNALLSRGLICAANDVMWLIMANNNDERKEKARRFTAALTLSYLTPIITLPLSNRLAMKSCAKLTKSFWSNNHKLIHISNKYLKNTASLKEGMEKLSHKYSYSPFESLYYKLKGIKPKKEVLNFDEILEKCGGKNEAGYEKLRKKLINTKSGILCSDFLFSTLTFGSIGFINNEITKRKTGKSGFSAEFNMADKSVVEKRARDYENSKLKRIGAFLAGTLAVGIATPLLLKKGLSANPASKFGKFIRNHAQKLDYEKGIYMSRLGMMLGVVLLGHTGALLATRNNSELKDNAIRFFSADAVILGGDIMLSTLLYKLSDMLFKTSLTKKGKGKLNKLLPSYKSLEEISEEKVAQSIKNKNKKAALIGYWAVLATISVITGIGIPKLVNSMTKKDVAKDSNKMAKSPGISSVNHKNKLQNETFSSFLEGIKVS